jgi:hypothetical protein
MLCAQNAPRIYSGDGQGTYLGRLSANPYDKDSISNPYGKYGSPYSSNSVNNPYGKYGSPYSPYSANNPYATKAPVIISSPRSTWSSWSTTPSLPALPELPSLPSLGSNW